MIFCIATALTPFVGLLEAAASLPQQERSSHGIKSEIAQGEFFDLDWRRVGLWP
jgi:hypothetical protein